MRRLTNFNGWWKIGLSRQEYRIQLQAPNDWEVFANGWRWSVSWLIESSSVTRFIWSILRIFHSFDNTKLFRNVFRSSFLLHWTLVRGSTWMVNFYTWRNITFLHLCKDYITVVKFEKASYTPDKVLNMCLDEIPVVKEQIQQWLWYVNCDLYKSRCWLQ